MRSFYCCLFLLLYSTRAHAQENFCFFAWSGDDAQKSNDFLAVSDPAPTLPGRGQALVFFRGETTPADNAHGYSDLESQQFARGRIQCVPKYYIWTKIPED